ncbi:MAG: four helix bundle protein [Caldilineaceae bacterium]|nr:four helix bundle protein [Caldilineaceae bacterium]
MTALQSYQELEVWKRSIVWVEKIYRASSAFPAEEKFGLTSQVRRAAVSVPANIAEGAARSGTGEFLQSLSVASGSLAEVETLLILAHRLNFLPEMDCKPLLQEAAEIGKMLSGLKRSLASRRSNPPTSR